MTIFISSHATLNDTLMAKHIGVLIPKSVIYTAKRDDEHARPYHMEVPPTLSNYHQISLGQTRENSW